MNTAFESAPEGENFEISQEVQLSIPFIPVWLDDYGLTPAEFRVYCHVVRRAGKNGLCWESVPRIAKACRLSRNLTMAALRVLTEVHRLLIKNKRVGETDEYTLAPSSDWASPVLQKDRVLSRIKRVDVKDSSLQSMSTDSTEEQLPVLEEDTKVIHIKEYLEKQQQEVVETLSIWRRNPDATRYCQIPPIYNQETGVEVQRQMETEGLTAQTVVERAIAFSKVPRLILEALSTITEKFLDGCKWLELMLLQSHPKTQVEAGGIPDIEFNRLKDVGIHLNHATASHLWQKYSSEWAKATAYVASKESVKDRAAYFLSCLEQGWMKDTTSQPIHHDPYELNFEQLSWYEWASSSKLCDGRPIKRCGLMSGEVAIVIFEPEFQCYATMPLSRAMQKYPAV
ncbi:MAG: helix-turn-helix domain-containing protein [Rhizonema sp. NSF051]|nr:helix-turn-helix domain-containing protein [Rhizonema sp. NSF051]